jgi:thiol:disulfide interchange protein DsbD
MSFGMGVPHLLIGASAGKLLPKPGRWMNATKAFFGIAMLALAIWMLSRVIPDFVTLLLYGVLAVSTGVHMGALEPIEKGAHGIWRLVKSTALLILIYGIMLVAGGVGKASDPLRPLAPFTGGAKRQVESVVSFGYVRTVAELEAAVNQSVQPVMVDFYADWCVNCKELETITFQDPAVKRLLAGFTLLKVDVTHNTQEDKALLKKFNLFGPPGLIFYKDGQELEALQLVGFIEPRPFETHLKKVIDKEL